MNFKIFNKTIILSLFFVTLSFNVQANEFQCSSEELATFMSKDKSVDREKILQNDLKEFERAYLVAKKREAQAKGDVSECLSILGSEIDFSKLGDAISDSFDGLFTSIKNGWAIFEQISKEAYEELSKGLCSRFVQDKSALIIDKKQKEIKKRALKNLRKSSLNKFVDDNLFDNWINSEIKESFNDSRGLLEWRNGLGGGLEKNIADETGKAWNDKLDKIFEGG